MLLTGCTGFIGREALTASENIKAVYRRGNVINSREFFIIDNLSESTT
jgi:hypothetical protein